MKKQLLTAFALLGAATVIAQTTQRLPLIEGFSSNTCPPCATWNASYTPILENNNANQPGTAQVAVLKYQMNWPSPGNDPSYNNMGNGRRTTYGVSSIPEWFIDGQANGGSQAEIDAAINNPAQLEIQAAYTITGTTIDVELDVTPLVDLGTGFRVYTGLANKEYTYGGGTNGESEFHHVLRTILPGGAGYGLTTLEAGVTQSKSPSYTYTLAAGIPAQGTYDFWDDQIEVIIWVQHPGTKEMLQAAIATEGSLGVDDGDTDDFGLLVFPNPVADNATVTFDANPNETMVMTVIDNLGRVVHEESFRGAQGRQRHEMSVSSLKAGLYQVRMVVGNKAATQALMVTH